MTALASEFQADEVHVQVLMTVIVEVRNVSIGIGIATSVANALANPKAGITNVESLIQHSPVLSFQFVEALNYIRSLDASSSVNKSLWQLMTKLRRAKVTTVEWALKSASPFGIPASKFLQTAQSWRASCRTAIEALDGLKLISQRYSIEICTSPAWSRISTFLDEVADGSHSWVGPDGEISVPEWADRRQAERLPIRSHGILSRGDTAREIVVRDIAETPGGLGLGLEGLVDAEPGDRVTIQLECGGIVAGKIVWTDQGRAGVEITKSYRA
jgi:hypothetical protein